MVSASPPPIPIRLRALGLAELLDETFRIYRRSFGLFAGLALAVTLPGMVMNLLSGSYRSWGWLTRVVQNMSNPDALPGIAQSPPPQTDPAIGLLASLVRLILVPVTAGVIIYTANEIIKGRNPTIVGALEGTLQRYWGLAGVALLGGVLLFAGILLITIPFVIWIAVRWLVGVPALLAEDLGPVNALGRSWQLIEGRWWRTVGIFLVVVIMATVASAILGATGGAIIGLVPGLSDDLRGALVQVTGSLTGALVLPVSYIAITLMYYDLRVRREGLDLDQLAQQAQPPSAA
ncbi:MAG TPA: glycerophosphoryl diester phosphodiesterase membrane domain-containing protein [Candidatus Limnocylindria bacterium]|nr:glycerophosphoryl diester phosphodiesterase membrane domain-containing protein [Candidatus Limnocylindria bacterium]